MRKRITRTTANYISLSEIRRTVTANIDSKNLKSTTNGKRSECGNWKGKLEIKIFVTGELNSSTMEEYNQLISKLELNTV